MGNKINLDVCPLKNKQPVNVPTSDRQLLPLVHKKHAVSCYVSVQKQGYKAELHRSFLSKPTAATCCQLTCCLVPLSC